MAGGVDRVSGALGGPGLPPHIRSALWHGWAQPLETAHGAAPEACDDREFAVFYVGPWLGDKSKGRFLPEVGTNR